MSKRSSAAEIIEMLPASTRRRLRIVDLNEVSGAVLVVDRIRQHFERVAASEKQLATWKVANGHCGGRPYCMAHVGKGSKHKMCADCRREMSNPQRTNRRSPYGVIRAKEKAKERGEAART